MDQEEVEEITKQLKLTFFGLDKFSKDLKDKLEASFTRHYNEPSKGIVLYGPPGTGKSAIS
jgi:ATP-dependent 26S proteasome regulatory subunit